MKITNYEIPHYIVFFSPPLTLSLLGAHIFFCALFSHPENYMVTFYLHEKKKINQLEKSHISLLYVKMVIQWYIYHIWCSIPFLAYFLYFKHEGRLMKSLCYLCVCVPHKHHCIIPSILKKNNINTCSFWRLQFIRAFNFWWDEMKMVSAILWIKTSQKRHLLLGTGLANTFLQQWIHMQWQKNCWLWCFPCGQCHIKHSICSERKEGD